MSENIVFDSRVVARNIKRGVVSQADYDKHLETLEDCAELAEETETQMVFKVEEGSASEDSAAPADA
jgi:hypothetical protein